MTVKVISDKPVRTKRTTCTKCGYELEFTGEDVHVSVDSDGDSYSTIRCPRTTCNERNHVKWP